MNMQELVNGLYKKILSTISETINPLVDEKNDWTIIESSINKWFDIYEILGWCFEQVELLDNNGVVFYNQYGVLLSVQEVCDSLEQDKFIDKAKADIMLHYGKKVPQKFIPRQCSANSRLVIKIFKDGRFGGIGCEDKPREGEDFI